MMKNESDGIDDGGSEVIDETMSPKDMANEGDDEDLENGVEEEIEEEFYDDEPEEYEYVYSDDENHGLDEGLCGGKRPLDLVEESFSSKRKYLDADGYSLRIWSEANVIRMAIVASVRQIIDHQSNQFRILCSSDQLDTPDIDELILSVFVDVTDTMTVVYELKFNTKVEMGISPPRLKCLTYCGLGTYLFPDHLLPNRFSKFINFGQLFDDLAQGLRQYDKKMIPFYSITTTSICYYIQELCYRTQYDTRCTIQTTDASVVTGLERKTQEEHPRFPGTQLRKGVGYSVGYEGNIIIDNSYMEMLIQLLHQILSEFPTTLATNQPNILDSPLDEILTLLLAEYSFEDLTRNPNFTSPLLTLIGKLESFYQVHGSVSRMEGTPSSPWLFSRNTYQKVATFQDVIGKDSESDYGFGSLQLPPEFNDLHFQKLSMNSSSSGDVTTGDLKSTHEETFDPVTFVESFRHHSFFHSGRSSANEVLTPNLLRRLRIEFATLATALPETIKLSVLESNFLYSKFLIIGPSDTPYEGGFFLFDMKLPPDYPNTNPSVKFLTTGAGTVRFNPNLYNCGKVCLSLLGTWSGEKWDPKISNINQVLQSICFLILVPEPYFNEPGYQSNQGTAQGDAQSRQYSANIRVHTIRHAVLGQLTHPDPEFCHIIRPLLKRNWPAMKEVYERWARDDHGAIINELIGKIERELAKRE